MEMVMTSKTNDTSNIATLKDHSLLADSELDAVSGGRIPTIHPAKVELGSVKITFSSSDPPKS